MTYRKTKSGLVDYAEVIGVEGLKITIDDSIAPVERKNCSHEYQQYESEVRAMGPSSDVPNTRQ